MFLSIISVPREEYIEFAFRIEDVIGVSKFVPTFALFSLSTKILSLNFFIFPTF